MQDRAIGNIGVDAMTNRDLLRLGPKRLEEGRMRLLRNQNAVHRNANLPHVGERAPRRGGRRLGDVGVTEYDERRLPAQLERQALHSVSRGAHD